MAENTNTPEWLEVSSVPAEPEFTNFAPGSTAEWLAIVTNTADQPVSLAVQVVGDPSPLIGPGGLHVAVEACTVTWDRPEDSRGSYSCAGDTSTIRALTEIGDAGAIGLRDLPAGETREYLARAVLPEDSSNRLQNEHGEVRLHFSSVLSDDRPDIPDTGADPLALILLAALFVVVAAVFKTPVWASAPGRRASRRRARG
ncbi:hypothetical protein [Phytoactinopolyspora mesophila]|uniref:Uncharacterized protein n=1 Tax=Phytoactinopolyspora mesophila TaxID=2650750 RepID=A0A7K3LWU6_9ACTN|nr:hypothetical protein [Phytoactinopolyspora mesophila]NDL55494.1 hypothetical protein [Phytoactinopolyspora mesophila]